MSDEKITLAKAMVLKNRLVEKLTKAKNLLSRWNSRKETKECLFNLNDVHNTIIDLRSQLITLKVKISEANKGILSDIILVSETKDYISFLQSLSTEAGHDDIALSSGVVTVKYVAFIDSKKQEELLAEQQKILDDALDRINIYSSTTYI